MSKASFQWNHCPPGQRPPDYICIGEIPKANGPVQTRAARGSRPGAELTGPPAPQQRPRPQRGGPDQAPRRPQHDPPRRSGTVGAPLSLPVLHCWGSRVQAAVPSARGNLAKGLQICRKTVPVGLRSRALSWSNFQARKMQRLTRIEFSWPGNVWVCKHCVFRFWKKSRWNLRRGVVDEPPFTQVLEPVSEGSSPGRGPAQGAVSRALPGPRDAPRFVYYLLHKGFAGRMGIFKAICFGNVLWDPTLVSRGKGIISQLEGAPSAGPGPLPGSTKERFDWRARSRASQSRGPLNLTI